MYDPFQGNHLPLGDWIQTLLDLLVKEYRPFFHAIRVPVGTLLDMFEQALVATNPIVFLIVLFLLCWQFAGLRSAIFSTAAMTLIGFLGLWTESMTTIALVLTAVLFTVVIGLPLGVWAAKSDRVEAALRPLLDVMQTLPGFVYMVPVVMLVGIGNVPGVIVTVIFALPPVIRLTSLGLREVPGETLEAARAFGATESRILFRIQIPLAANTIMVGVNQTIMMALSMVVYASMIAVEGLGQMVLRGIGRLDVGLAAVGGIGIVILAMILDRITRGIASRSRASQRGPIAFVRSLLPHYSRLSHARKETQYGKLPS
ncbi:MAG: ABC transporter permease [Parvibaculaceae bacterium]